MFVEKSEGAEEFVERCGLIVGVCDGKLRASGQAGAEREKKERYSEDEGFAGRAWKNGLVVCGARQKSVPVDGGGKGVQCGIGRWHGHKRSESADDSCQDQYSIV
jgi:hypothetical protein